MVSLTGSGPGGAAVRWSRRLLPGILLLAVAAPAGAQVSPGPLARAHQSVDQPLKCLSCHGQKSGTMRERCLACHQEIGFLIERRRGLHARETEKKCEGCHPDHAGREFAMVTWEEGKAEKFDHARAGWKLEGRHATAKCGDCHREDRRVGEAARRAPSPKLPGRRSWIGLDPACAPCHAGKDVHRGALGQECGKCHDAVAWKPAPRFDHAATAYPLTGRHARVECGKCHLAPNLSLERDGQGRPIPRYKPLPFQECSACHRDVHAGRLGAACARCHTTEDFKKVNSTAFNHDVTRYPLRGRHATVKCAGCHDPVKAWGKKPAFAACGSCHRDDHAGQATLAGRIVDCAACHAVEGFKPSTYTVAQHLRTDYPLEGRHQNVKCEACHRRNPPGVAPARLGRAGTLLRMAHRRCTDCHADDHGGQLARPVDRRACESCHAVEGWKPSLFTVAQHARLRLPLEGKHRTASCGTCHGPNRPGLPPLPGAERLGRARVALTGVERECTACHADPHQGRYTPGGARAVQNGCLACHDTNGFRPSRFGLTAHRSFGYELKGAHQAVACDGCHRELKAGPATSSLVLARPASQPRTFAVKDRRCEACHEDPHGGQFASRGARRTCESCHSEQAFRPASGFDHGRDAGFPLSGAHAAVACAGCHPARSDSRGRRLVIYRPVPRDCRSCHARGIPGAPPGKAAPVTPARSAAVRRGP